MLFVCLLLFLCDGRNFLVSCCLYEIVICICCSSCLHSYSMISSPTCAHRCFSKLQTHVQAHISFRVVLPHLVRLLPLRRRPLKPIRTSRTHLETTISGRYVRRISDFVVLCSLFLCGTQCCLLWGVPWCGEFTLFVPCFIIPLICKPRVIC